MGLGYKLAVLPIVGGFIGKGIVSASEGSGFLTNIGIAIVIIGMLAYIGWISVKGFIIGFHPEEKREVFISLLVWLACLFLAIGLIFR